MTSLSSTMMMVGESPPSAAAFSKVCTSTPRHSASLDIIAASGRRLPFSHRATVGWVTYISSASSRCENPRSILTFLRVSANSAFIPQCPPLLGRHEKLVMIALPRSKAKVSGNSKTTMTFWNISIAPAALSATVTSLGQQRHTSEYSTLPIANLTLFCPAVG